MLKQGPPPPFCSTQRKGGLRPLLILVQLLHFTDEDTDPEVFGCITAVSQGRLMDLLHSLSEVSGQATCEPEVKVSVVGSGPRATCEPKMEVSVVEEAS